MRTKLHVDEIVESNEYWYIYTAGGKHQLFKLKIEQISLENDNPKILCTINLDQSIETPEAKRFSEFPIAIKIDDWYVDNIFELSDRADAEIHWIHTMYQKLESNTYVNYEKFREIDKRFREDYPELLLKGIK